MPGEARAPVGRWGPERAGGNEFPRRARFRGARGGSHGGSTRSVARFDVSKIEVQVVLGKEKGMFLSKAIKA